MPALPPVLDPLTRLAIRHGSDKFGGHLYTPLYERTLRHLREKPIRFLEIGIGGYDEPGAGGSSLRMWADYFPAARIVGLDIAAKEFARPDRVAIERGSQDDPAVLDALVQRYGAFDVIVDDGSHLPAHIVASFRHLYPRMAEDGVYIVEDTQLAFSPGAGGDNAGSATIFGLAQSIALAMHAAEGHVPANAGLALLGRITARIEIARNVAIFHRGANTYPSNLAFTFDHPEVGAVYGAMAREAEANPAPRDALSRIDMDIWGGRRDVAARLALEAAARWPHDRELLIELERMMRWAQRPLDADTLRARREALPPG